MKKLGLVAIIACASMSIYADSADQALTKLVGQLNNLASQTINVAEFAAATPKMNFVGANSAWTPLCGVTGDIKSKLNTLSPQAQGVVGRILSEFGDAFINIDGELSKSSGADYNKVKAEIGFLANDLRDAANKPADFSSSMSRFCGLKTKFAAFGGTSYSDIKKSIILLSKVLEALNNALKTIQ